MSFDDKRRATRPLAVLLFVALCSTVAARTATTQTVIWNRRNFPADFLLEFEMSPYISINGLTIVFFCVAGRNSEDIFDLSLPPRRRAEYRAYHSGVIGNYTDSYWSRNNEAESVSNRLRKNPGFKQVAEGS